MYMYRTVQLGKFELKVCSVLEMNRSIQWIDIFRQKGIEIVPNLLNSELFIKDKGKYKLLP